MIIIIHYLMTSVKVGYFLYGCCLFCSRNEKYFLFHKGERPSAMADRLSPLWQTQSVSLFAENRMSSGL